MYELYTRYTLTAPKGEISPAGIYELLRFISNANLRDEVWAQLNPDNQRPFLPELPEDWQWVWLVNSGEYRGTFPKRIASFYFKAWHIKCPDSFISEIGNIARRHTEDSASYTFEFVNRFDWEDGDFGDENSCLWGSYEYARGIMEENGALAVRFYNGYGEGFARAWLYPISDILHVVWNGYGFPQATIVIARVVAQFLNASYKRIELSNYHSSSGPVYINSGIGYAIGSPDALKGIDEYDFEWDADEREQCFNCGRMLHEDEVNYGPDDLPYCDDCFDRYFERCAHCGEAHLPDTMTYVESVNGSVCDFCLEHYFEQCESCKEYQRRGHMMERDGKRYCTECHSQLPKAEE
jgi:hypothetical protein